MITLLIFEGEEIFYFFSSFFFHFHRICTLRVQLLKNIADFFLPCAL